MEIKSKSLGTLYIIWKDNPQLPFEGVVYPSDKPDRKYKAVWETGAVTYFNSEVVAQFSETPSCEIDNRQNENNNNIIFQDEDVATYRINKDTEPCVYQSALLNLSYDSRVRLWSRGWNERNYIPWLKKGQRVELLACCDTDFFVEPMYVVKTASPIQTKCYWTIVYGSEITKIDKE